MKVENLKIGVRLYAGFGVVIGALGGLAYFTVDRLQVVTDVVNTSERLSMQTRRTQDLMTEIVGFRRVALRYTWDLDPAARAAAEASLSKGEAIARDVLSTARSEERKVLYRGLVAELGKIGSMNKSLLEQGDKLKAAKAVLFPAGDVAAASADKAFAMISTKGGEYADRASKLLSATLLVRVANWRFLAVPEASGIETFKKRFAEFKKAADDLGQMALSDVERAAVGDVKTKVEAYAAAFDTAAPALLGMTVLYAGQMVPLFEGMEKSVLQISDSLKTASDAQGKKLAETTAWVSTAQIWLGSLTVLFGILIAFLTARSITGPITSMVSAMGLLAKGEFETVVPALERRDEVGDMAKAVNVFKQSGIERVALEKQAAEERVRAEAERTRSEAERAAVAREQANVVSELGNGLSRLASRDLTVSLAGFPADYKKIEGDFNAAVSALRQAIMTVAENTQMILSGSGEISTAADDLSKRTEQQAASLEETSAALDQITVTGKKAAEGANHAREVVTVAQADAARTGEVVRKTVDAMGNIEKSAQQVNQIIGVIDEIAFQTNLLALNAGVEAARAGEAGRGFAVVASEVRALAQRSAEAAKEIKGLISTSSMQVAEGVELVAETGKALERILTQVNDINKVVVDIASGAQEQATGLAQVNTAINQMDQATQQNASMVEQSTAASHSLAQEARQLADLVGQFQLGGGSGKSAGAVSRPSGKSKQAAVPQLKSAPGRVTSAAVVKESADKEWEEF